MLLMVNYAFHNVSTLWVMKQRKLVFNE